MHFKTLFAQCQPFFSGLNVVMQALQPQPWRSSSWDQPCKGSTLSGLFWFGNQCTIAQRRCRDLRHQVACTAWTRAPMQGDQGQAGGAKKACIDTRHIHKRQLWSPWQKVAANAGDIGDSGGKSLQNPKLFIISTRRDSHTCDVVSTADGSWIRNH